MKKKLLPLLVLFLTNVQAAQISNQKIKEQIRKPSSVEDIGVVGPNGKVILYYREGDFINLRYCKDYSILGSNPMSAKENCIGDDNKVHVDVMKRIIKELVKKSNGEILAPLTEEEIEKFEYYKYLSNDPYDVEPIEKKINEIKSFIDVYGEDNANMGQLHIFETRLSAIKKINTETDKVISLISNSKKLDIRKASTHSEEFIYSVLRLFDPFSAALCGVREANSHRVLDCNLQSDANKGNFTLITRPKRGVEINRDNKTGLIWSDVFKTETFYDANYTCNVYEKYSGVKLNKKWRLPTIQEYREANKNGITKSLPRMNQTFWSATKFNSDKAYVFDGETGTEKTHPTRYDDYFPVRCVTE